MLVSFWSEFALLFAASIVGTCAVLPYSLRLLPKDRPLRLSMRMMLLISIAQGAVVFAVVTALGLFFAHRIGLGATYLEALLSGMALPSSAGLLIGLVTGALAGAALLISDLGFVPYWPDALRYSALKTTLTENFLASFYGGINEELLVRFFGLSLLVWLLLFVFHQTTIVFWTANIVMTVLFGLGHLPALKKLLGSISRAMLVRSLVLNAPIGLLCGWLFWAHGIEAAMLAHFSADIVYHVFGTVVLRRRFA